MTELSRSVDVRNRDGLARFLELIIRMFGDMSLAHLLDFINLLTPELTPFRPRDYCEFIVREIDDVRIYMHNKLIRVSVC